MIFVYGGIYNGKLQYVKNTYNISDNDIYDCSKVDKENYIGSSFADDVLLKYKCIYNANCIVKDIVTNDKNIKDLYDIFYKNKDKDIIVVSDDVSCGIVPIDKIDRKYREEVSRFNTYLSSISKDVYRVFLGIATKIK